MKTITTFVLALLATGPVLFGQVLLNDTFADNNRSNQSLTGSSAWYLRSFGTTTLSASSGSLVFTQNATPVTTNILTYFTNSGSPFTLADGQTLSTSFTLSVSNVNNTAGTLRLGLFNSGGSRVSTDDTTNFTSTTFNAYTGYQVGFSTGATATNYSLNERTGTNTAIFAGAATTQLNTNPTNVAINATANTPFNVNFSIARSGTSYTLNSDINGQSVSVVDNSISASAFDTLALQFSTGAVSGSGTITLDNVNVGVIPEPSTYALLVLGGLGLITLRRINRR